MSSSKHFFIAPIMGGGPIETRENQRRGSGGESGQLTAEKHLGVDGGGGEVLFDHGSVDESNSSGPVVRGVVEDVVDVEALGVLGRERVELGLEEDVLVRDVGVDERELGGVERVLE